MKRFFYTLFIISIFTACNQSPSQTEKDYTENLEKKNGELQKELQQMRESPNEETKKDKVNHESYFTIGSTEDEVLEVMGDPASLDKIGPFKTYNYGLSYIRFKDGRVESYGNTDGNLKIKVKK